MKNVSRYMFLLVIAVVIVGAVSYFYPDGTSPLLVSKLKKSYQMINFQNKKIQSRNLVEILIISFAFDYRDLFARILSGSIGTTHSFGSK